MLLVVLTVIVNLLLLCKKVIHNLSMWTARDKSLSFDQLKVEAGKAQKDQHLVVLLYCCVVVFSSK